MDLAELRARVDAVMAQDAEDRDPEGAHFDEDALVVEVLRAIADGAPNSSELAREVLRTAGRQDVTRWYA